jgi:hypothetical protein
MVLTFEELRKVKDSLPHGSIEKIAGDLHLDVQTVRNYFGSDHFSHDSFVGAHYEPGVHGGYVKLDNEQIYETAMKLIEQRE